MTTTAKNKEKIRFSKAFWVANTVELFERAAYYGVFIVITLYLSRILGFNDIQAATIAGTFSAFLYLLPTFAGALADKIGFRNSMLLAFTLLTIGSKMPLRKRTVSSTRPLPRLSAMLSQTCRL